MIHLFLLHLHSFDKQDLEIVVIQLTMISYKYIINPKLLSHDMLVNFLVCTHTTYQVLTTNTHKFAVVLCCNNRDRKWSTKIQSSGILCQKANMKQFNIFHIQIKTTRIANTEADKQLVRRKRTCYTWGETEKMSKQRQRSPRKN